MTRHFLKDTDLTPSEQAQVLDLAARLKADRHDDVYEAVLDAAPRPGLRKRA